MYTKYVNLVVFYEKNPRFLPVSEFCEQRTASPLFANRLFYVLFVENTCFFCKKNTLFFDMV